ncbi:ATP-binding cassette domain-containing protein [Planobispora siamensis]|uniref:ABC transporter n=1 Tax=Planobispora siamensis TaxID=936338 RepID=A0A8J3SM75_9ACTN|nr:ABC transporter ATP-binding protein [Planobispora siamensis]GIH95775.1 ABC transporter [Planobispora siamensis]
MNVIRTRALTKRYGKTLALDGLDLEVPGPAVFGYLGPNGAGKTTTIRLLAGLLRATSGHAEVLGLDIGRDRDRAQRRIGYLPGQFTAYPDLTGDQYLRYLAGLRGGVGGKAVAGLAERFDVDLSRRIGGLSHGNRQKIGLIQAFMHEPELLILDEPTIGLDPLMQREFLALVRETRDAGRTVFLSSHILDEVEAVADTVAILRRGHLVVVRPVGELKAQAVRRMELVFAGEPPLAEAEKADGVREATADGSRLHLVVEGSTAELLRVAAPYGIESVVTHEPDLEEIFMTYYEER